MSVDNWPTEPKKPEGKASVTLDDKLSWLHRNRVAITIGLVIGIPLAIFMVGYAITAWLR